MNRYTVLCHCHRKILFWPSFLCWSTRLSVWRNTTNFHASALPWECHSNALPLYVIL